jgi:uncharacterized protein
LTNRLIKESSPYLLQHAQNPVDWYPWGEEALKRASSENKPILLSVGYSACHWCHVMAHECFENNAIASLMNEKFINIKVDREERPDIDSIYMEAVQLMTKGGGWPLTVFLTPALKPFYGGTYFPPEDRPNLPGFPRVLKVVSEAYTNHRSDVLSTAEQIAGALIDTAKKSAANEDLNDGILNQAFLLIQDQFDNEHGGFGSAPKFPSPLVLEFLLRYYSRYQENSALKMVEVTLRKMAEGGIFDQIGGGFHRYATDDAWQIPHFEKMLYDNALLSRVYLHAYLITQNQLYSEIAQQTLDYVLREMTSPEWGFYCAQDADSEGEEGKYYTWTIDEVNDALGIELGQRACRYFGVSFDGNFEGHNILHRTEYFEIPDIIGKIKKSLLEIREKRVKPARDEKILASWNGLMLTTLAEAALVFNRQDYKTAALKNGSFLINSMIAGGKIQHSFKDGKARLSGFLEDYAQVIEGFLALHFLTLEGKWLNQAFGLGENIAALFINPDSGLLSDTEAFREDLIIRPRNEYDGVVPSAVSTAAGVLLKMARITGNSVYTNYAARELSSVKAAMLRYPLGYCNWLGNLDFYLSDPEEIAVIGSLESPETEEMMRIIASKWIPNKLLVGLDKADPQPFIRSPLLAERAMINDRTTVYLCQGNTCRPPIVDKEALFKALEQKYNK